MVTGILGEGGFGIVYSALDEQLGRTIAIKEYLPSAIAGRTDTHSVRVRSAANVEAFTNGLQSFMREAKLLAQFSHPALVDIYRVWEQNDTAYLAMRLCAGRTARATRASLSRGVTEAEMRQLLLPVFDAVMDLHERNVIHRDISPDNIMISPTGSATLLDLGAARMVLAGLTQALTTVLKPGYAPIEQYVDDGSMAQGTWTDVYGLGALIYYLAVGHAPAQAIARTMADSLDPLPVGEPDGYSSQFSAAVTRALAVHPAQRTQTVADLAEGLGWSLQRTRASTPLASSLGAAVSASEILRLPVSQRAESSEHVKQNSLASFAADPDATVVVAKAEKAAPHSSGPSGAFEANVSGTVSAQHAAHSKSQSAQEADLLANKGSPPQTIPSTLPTHPSVTPTRRKFWFVGAGVVALGAITALGVNLLIARSQQNPAPNVASTEMPAERPAGKPEPIKAAPPPAAPPTVEVAQPNAPPTVATYPANTNTPDLAAQSAAKNEQKQKEDEAKRAQLLQQQKQREVKEVAARAAEKQLKEQMRLDRAAKQQQEEKEVADRIAAQKREALAQAEKPKTEPTKKTADVSPAQGAPSANDAVNDLSALALKAYRDGQLQNARAYWSQIAAHPAANSRSRAQAWANSARTYCMTNDRAECERFYTLALRADATWRLSDTELQRPQLTEAYRAARAKAGGY